MIDAEPVEFEAAMAEVETIVEALERGGPDLNGALASYARGIDLLAACQKTLDRAERSVALLTGVAEDGEPVTAPFDAAATAATPAPAPIEAPTADPGKAARPASVRLSGPASSPEPPAPAHPITPDRAIPEAPF